MKPHKLAIVWLRRDLRLHDNPALWRACELAEQVVVLYVHCPEEEAPFEPGAASHWWLHHSLLRLGESLAERGAQLNVVRGSSQALVRLADELGASLVLWNRLYEPAVIARDTALKAQLKEAGVEVISENGHLLIEPWQLLKDDGTPYQVFTPYYKRFLKRFELRSTYPVPTFNTVALDGCADVPAAVAELGLLPDIPWDTEFYDHWVPGEAQAKVALAGFADRVADYQVNRDIPSRPGTSKLAPHLHFGEISVVAAWHELNHFALEEPQLEAGAEFFQRELAWREFAHMLLFHFPESVNAPLRKEWSGFPWKTSGPLLGKWQQGDTGIPMVDAGMRELWRTGWMHNRVRMIVASFLTKNLGFDWREGAAWFWDTLVDADLANNTFGWQWAAGCGADAAPYFRIFNPETQGKKFDPKGLYVLRYVPELTDRMVKKMHGPLGPEEQAKYAYPPAVVDLSTSRRLALDEYAAYKEQSS